MASNVWDRAEALVPAAQSGDQSAIATIIDLTQADVVRFLATHATAADADDLAQETYARMLVSLPRFERRSSLRTWLLVIARRVVADHLRLRSRRPRTVGIEEWTATAERSGEPSSSWAPDPSAAFAIADLMDRLPADRREALVLTQMIGLPYSEAAEVLGCPVGTVRSRVSRGRDDLIRMLAVDEERRARRTSG